MSERGEYEYYIEYTEDQGDINLLLYYDTEDQWPSVYKTNKTCREKEAVLKVEQNQVINLTVKYPYNRDVSGCYFAPKEWVTDAPKQHTISIPTVPTRKVITTSTTTTTAATTTLDNFEYSTTTESENGTTEDVNMQFEEIFENLEDFNYETNVRRFVSS